MISARTVLENFNYLLKEDTAKDVDEFFLSVAKRNGFYPQGRKLEKNFKISRDCDRYFCLRYSSELYSILKSAGFKVRKFPSGQAGVYVDLMTASLSDKTFFLVNINVSDSHQKVSVSVICNNKIVTNSDAEKEAYTVIEKFFAGFNRVNDAVIKQVEKD
jgi:hypothetical protein